MQARISTSRQPVPNRIKTRSVDPRFRYLSADFHRSTQMIRRSTDSLFFDQSANICGICGQASHLSIITSVDLMTAVTESPGLSWSLSAELRVIAETISMPPAAARRERASSSGR